MHTQTDTIAAISTPQGSGALGIIRVSGPQAIEWTNALFSRDLSVANSHTLNYGTLHAPEGELLDEVVVGLFRAPRSFTKEDVVEISCHGSPYVLRRIMEALMEMGCRPARAGEFTQRAFLNGAMDLAQAEAVADLIAAQSKGAHELALNQLRGGVSSELKDLREKLLNFTSLIELELDFSEEDVEFADRSQLEQLISLMDRRISGLIESFRLGNALKQGVPTVILGKPNAGKSTLLNALLNDNRAIVSDIPGTTRDVIEDRLMMGGIEFRLMDTAGIRETVDVIEAEGVHRSLNLARKAQVVLYVFDATTETPGEAITYLSGVQMPASTSVVLLANKLDLVEKPEAYSDQHDPTDMPIGWQWFGISAKQQLHLQAMKDWLVESLTHRPDDVQGQAIISSSRHLHALQQAHEALQEVQNGMQLGVSGDLLAIDIRTVLHHIGEITGEISTDEVLGNIFSKFCIGK